MAAGARWPMRSGAPCLAICRPSMSCASPRPAHAITRHRHRQSPSW